MAASTWVGLSAVILLVVGVQLEPLEEQSRWLFCVYASLFENEVLELVLCVREAEIPPRAHVSRKGDGHRPIARAVGDTGREVDERHRSGEVVAERSDQSPVVTEVRLRHLVSPMLLALLGGISIEHSVVIVPEWLILRRLPSRSYWVLGTTVNLCDIFAFHF